MKRAKEIFAAVLGGSIAFAYLFYVINSVISFTNIGSGSYNGALASTVVLSVIDLFLATAAIIILILSMVRLIKGSTDNSPLALFILGLMFVSLEKVVNVLGAIIIVSIYNDGVVLDGKSIAIISFLIISLILFAVSTGVRRSKAKGASGILGTIGALFFLIVLFMSMSSGVNGLSLIYLTISLVAYIGVFAFFIFDIVTDFIYVAPASIKEIEEEIEVPTNATNESLDKSSAEQALLRLKRLFDSGVITQEEYEEKRKHYIDSL